MLRPILIETLELLFLIWFLKSSYVYWFKDARLPIDGNELKSISSL